MVAFYYKGVIRLISHMFAMMMHYIFDEMTNLNFSHVCNVVIDGPALPYHCHLSDEDDYIR